MSTQPLDVATIETSALADGILVRLRGRLDAGTVPALRAVLLRTRPAGCDDVMVDAGGVESIDDAALAVLLAAPLWAEITGGNFAYTRVSEDLTELATATGVADLLPRLAAPGQRQARD